MEAVAGQMEVQWGRKENGSRGVGFGFFQVGGWRGAAYGVNAEGRGSLQL